MTLPQDILPEDRFFTPEPRHLAAARQLYQTVKDLPIVAPHGHVDPRLFSDPDFRFGSPAELLILPDHYVLRMLYANGVSLESLGVPTMDGTPVETDHRKIWQRFADHFYLFRGTPSGIWLRDSLKSMFGIRQKLNEKNAQSIYDQIQEKLKSVDFAPRALYERLNIEVLCTTDAATDSLEYHTVIRQSDWHGQILPTFRPDQLVQLDKPGWLIALDHLSEMSGISVTNYDQFICALENRRVYFKSLGATAADHGTETAFTGALSKTEADRIFQSALKGEVTQQDAVLFSGQMMMEFARMSLEDGLVMQWHVGSYRNHNPHLFNSFGPDIGADIPVRTEFTRAIKPLLDRFGNETDLSIILFTLDETTYSRELAPLVGHYPAIKLGPPWWFHDSLNGMTRYFDQVMETAGIYNTVGFNDDTRALLSIPARHDVWRRASVNWVTGLWQRGIVDETDAHEMVIDLSYRLAKKAYRFNS